ncbi:hypothetical protein HKX48_001511 [Thoreauomyces humboldtii]|nr:hypothetical protein HKX48_001511 [Thoreauomyces humboldtii]
MSTSRVDRMKDRMRRHGLHIHRQHHREGSSASDGSGAYRYSAGSGHHHTGSESSGATTHLGHVEKVLDDQLAKLGLVIKDVAGDGNCLFRALADQLTGTPGTHADQRASTCAFMESHADDFSPFIDESEKGGFPTHVNRMRQDGCYGGNIEIVAFARAHDVDVAVHQAGEPVWIVEGSEEDSESGSTPAPSSTRRALHIVYFTWEHYASVRNRDGPHDGLPCIDPALLATATAPPASQPQSGTATKAEQVVMDASTSDDLPRVRAMLEELGNPKLVTEILLDELVEEDAAKTASTVPPNDSYFPPSATHGLVLDTTRHDLTDSPTPTTPRTPNGTVRPRLRDKQAAARKARKAAAMARKGGLPPPTLPARPPVNAAAQAIRI